MSRRRLSLNDVSGGYDSQNASPSSSGEKPKIYRIDFPGEGIYEGQMLDGKREGKGRLMNASGFVIFEGVWANDQRNGYGISKYVGGDRHEGNYFQNERHGPGLFLWSDGDKYTGNFEEGRIHGYGRYVWSNGNMYTGQWDKGSMTGEGLFCKSTGDELQGRFVDGLLSGWGRKKTGDNDLYSGFFRTGVLNGYGTVSMASNKNYFEGIWRDGVLERCGRFSTTNTEKIKYRLPEEEIFCSGKFPFWPNEVGNVSIIWAQGRSLQMPLEAAGLGHRLTDLTMKENCYIGAVDAHDIDVVDRTTTTSMLLSSSVDNDTGSSSSSAAAAASSATGTSKKASSSADGSHHSRSEARYGRIEFSNGLVYEGECRELVPDGMGCLFNPSSFQQTLCGLTPTTSSTSSVPTGSSSNNTRSPAFQKLSHIEIEATIERYLTGDIVIPIATRYFPALVHILPTMQVRSYLTLPKYQEHRTEEEEENNMSVESLLVRRGGRYVGRFVHGARCLGTGCLVLENGFTLNKI